MTQPHYIDRACQKCGGEIQGWTCQGCGQVFRENDDGTLVFDPMEAVAWRYEHPDRGGWAFTDDAETARSNRGQALAVIPTEAVIPNSASNAAGDAGGYINRAEEAAEIVTEWLAMVEKVPPQNTKTLRCVPICRSEIDAIAALTPTQGGGRD